MSPLAEKLVVILEDREKLAALLSESRRHESAKDETIAALQHSIETMREDMAKMETELTELQEDYDELQDRLESVLLSASDPEDAKLKSRVDALYAAMAPKPFPAPQPVAANAPAPVNGHSVRVSVSSAAMQVAAPSPTIPRGESPASLARGNANPTIPVATPIRVSRSVTPAVK